MNTSSSRIPPRQAGRAREQVSLQFQTSDDARRARARGASALRVAGPVAIASRLGMSLAGFLVLGVDCRGSRPSCAVVEEHHSAWLQRAHSRMCLRAVGAAPTTGVCAAQGESVACRDSLNVPAGQARHVGCSCCASAAAADRPLPRGTCSAGSRRPVLVLSRFVQRSTLQRTTVCALPRAKCPVRARSSC